MIQAYAAHSAGSSLEPFTYDPGPLRPDEVEIRVASCGLCHSDVSMWKNDWGMTQYPFVPGHEVSGTIEAVGDQVHHLQVGQAVGLGWHAGYCQTCPSCLEGDQNLCSQAQGTIVGHHGGFADKVRAQAASVVPLPEGMNPETAGPLFCGGITVFNPLVEYNIPPTAKVAVIGIGGLGHLALAFLNAWGCEVTAFTSNPSKRDEALRLGAHETLDSTKASELEAAAGRFDLILSTVNVKLDWSAYINTLKAKGRLHFLGATLEPVEIEAFSLIGAQRQISGSPVGSPATIAKMLEFAARHQIEPVVEYFKFAQVNEALQHLESGQARYRVVLRHES
ncbi:MAG: NADPH-dependent aldehyde reductase Ahr [Opitutales bacterium]